VAVIDDAIKRQVYSKECATIFDIAEQTIIQEVNKVRQRKKAEKAKIDNRRIRTENRNNQNSAASTSQQTPQKPQPNPTGGEMDYEIPMEAMLPPDFMEEIGVDIGRGIENDLYYFELDLIRILLNYGTFVMVTENVEYDENDVKKVTEVEVPVIELIIHELSRDEIEFTNTVFAQILKEYEEGKNEGILYPIKHFTQHQDLEVSKVVADIMADRHEISANWLTQKVRITREVDKLEQAVMSSIYAFKNKRVKDRNEEIQTRLDYLFTNMDTESYDEQISLLAEKRKLDELKRILSDKLGRIT